MNKYFSIETLYGQTAWTMYNRIHNENEFCTFIDLNNHLKILYSLYAINTIDSLTSFMPNDLIDYLYTIKKYEDS